MEIASALLLLTVVYLLLFLVFRFVFREKPSTFKKISFALLGLWILGVISSFAVFYTISG